MAGVIDILIGLAALGSALVAGIFFTFSNFVMPALSQLSPKEGAGAMQRINVTVLNPGFFLAFFGTGLVSLTLAVIVLSEAMEANPTYLLAAAALYLTGCLGVTMVGNVPLNNRLASVESGSPEADRVWRQYLSRWTFWNHVRTVASLIAAGLFGYVL